MENKFQLAKPAQIDSAAQSVSALRHQIVSGNSAQTLEAQLSATRGALATVRPSSKYHGLVGALCREFDSRLEKNAQDKILDLRLQEKNPGKKLSLREKIEKVREEGRDALWDEPR